jgi:pyruvate dehydrogenase E1 component alpha subunit
MHGFVRRLPDYAPGRLLDLFGAMLRIRRVEEEIERRYHQDQMQTPIHLVIGQEATAVGACAALRLDDLVYASHRTHGVYLAKGGDLKAMLCEMHCRSNGCVGSRGGSMHLIDKSVGMAGTSAIVAGAVPLAAGAALAARMQQRNHVVVVFFGEAATEEGALAETLNAATLWRLPLVFFCENNFYSVQSPLATRQPERDLVRWAEGFGLPAERTDGTNVLAVFECVQRAVDRARAGDGPSFVEAPVYRFRAHGGAGDDSQTGYRQVSERESWEAHCPVEQLSTVLKTHGLLSEDAVTALEHSLKEEITEAFDFALSSPAPIEADLYQRVYSD